MGYGGGMQNPEPIFQPGGVIRLLLVVVTVTITYYWAGFVWGLFF
jgi:hypothetical protein